MLPTTDSILQATGGGGIIIILRRRDADVGRDPGRMPTGKQTVPKAES